MAINYSELFGKQDFYKTLMDNIYDGVYFVDRDRKILYWNHAAEQITGYTSDEVMGNHCWDKILMHVSTEGCNLCVGKCPLMVTIQDGVSREEMLYLHHKKGHRVPIYIRVSPIRDDKGEIIGAVETFSDLSIKNAAIERVEELEKLAYIDHLTGLANRRYTEINLDGRMHELQQFGWLYGIIFMDIDHFKKVNDELGHDMGDEVLKMVSKTLLSVCRTFDVLGRWGGEEFMAVIPKVNKETLLTIANRFKLLVQESVITLNSHKIQVTISLGATMGSPEDTKETITTRVDKLMYQSKLKKGNCVSVDE